MWLIFIMVAHAGLDCDTSRCLSGQSWVPLDTNKQFASRKECESYLRTPEWIRVIDQTTPVYVECRKS
jgi:hypothetical protein